MTKEECIRKIAQRYYEIREKHDIPGSADSDWRYAGYVFDFFDDDEAIRDSEWKMKLDDYSMFASIYDEYKGRYLNG